MKFQKNSSQLKHGLLAWPSWVVPFAWDIAARSPSKSFKTPLNGIVKCQPDNNVFEAKPVLENISTILISLKSIIYNYW